MPKTKIKTTAPHPHHVPLAMAFMIATVFILTLALLFVWNMFPHEPAYVPPQNTSSTIPVVPTPTPEAHDCGTHGHWNGTACDCGGIAGWSCPANQECGDMKPSPTTPDAMGTCRATSAPVSSGPIREAQAGMICDTLNFICVDEKVQNSLLSSPFTVKGNGFAFENTFNWRLVDASGAKLEEGNVISSPADVGKAGEFEIRGFILHVPTKNTGTLEVFEYSAKDGTPIHMVKIPVKLPTTTMTSRFYMAAPSDGRDCSLVEGVDMTVPRSSLPVETALRALLEFGPTMSSKRTAIPAGTQLVSITVSGGTAKVVFSQELENYGGGSCNVQAIRGQIEQTLKQFSSVKNVVISVVGKTAAQTLQP